MTPITQCKKPDLLIAAVLTTASLTLYAVTAAPSVATLFDDSLEFQVVSPTLGIAHPSGYPFYTLLGKLATLLIPVRDPAGRLNLLSACCAALAIGVLYLIARKLAGSRSAALVATGAFALSPAWWSQATIAEVYALHGLLFVLTIYCLLRWEEVQGQATGVSGQGPGRGQQRIGTERHPSASIIHHSAVGDAWLVAAALAFGLGMTHHRMIALLAPAAAIFVLWTDPALIRQPRRWLRPLGCALTPLLLYLYLPLRGAAGVTSLDGTYSASFADTLDWILARGYSVFLTGNPFEIERNAGAFVAQFLAQIGVLMLLAALLGIASSWKFAARRYVFLLLLTIVQIAFGLLYKVPDIEVFLLPAFMLVALWAAWGLAPVFDNVTQQVAHLVRPLHLPLRLRPIYAAAPLLLVAFVMLFEPVRAALRAFPEQDRSRAWGVYDYGEDILASTVPDARIVGLLGETTLVRYLRDVLGQRPDLLVVPADAETARFAAVEAALADGVPVYLTRDLPGAAARYSLDAAGPLIAVSHKAAPSPAQAGRNMGAGVVLIDALSEVRHPHRGPVVRLSLTWTATAPVGEELKVSARLLDGAGNVLVADDRIPVHFAYPTTAWVPGERVDDVYDLVLPPAVPSGPYGMLLILYRAADGNEVSRVELPPVPVN